MIQCPICSAQYDDIETLICTECGYDFSLGTAVNSEQPEQLSQLESNSLSDKQISVNTSLDNIETQLVQLKESFKQDKNNRVQIQQQQDQRISVTEKKLEEFHSHLYNLAKYIEKLAHENTNLRTRLQEFLENPQPLSISNNQAQAIQSITTQKGQDKNFTENANNGINLEMVYIPSGEYTMGSTVSDDEKPPHQVTIDEFYLGKYPITQAQYQLIMGDNTSDFQGDRLPVECVSWDDAREFCDRLSKITGKTYSLPTESQWEYACRAGNSGKWCFGNDEYRLRDYGWYSDNSNKKTHPVGTKKPNAWGLYDMHGNIWEWCEDRYIKSYRQTPKDGSAFSEQSIPYVVLRGGSWFISSFYCRSAERTRATYDSISSDVGFRVMCQM